MTKEDLELDLSKITFSKEKALHFLKKYGIFLLVLIPVLLAAYIRLIPSTMPITDDWARSTVDSYYKNQIGNQIREQYPNLPNENIQPIIEQQYSDFQKQNKELIKQQIKETSGQIKSSFQDENGYIYMPDIDPYQWLRYARNYIEKGQVGDEVRNGIQWDNHMLAPKGTDATSRPHPIVLAYLYKIMKIFSSKITLMQSATYFPVILAALSIIPIFFIARMFAGNVGGFFAGIMMAVNGAFIGRTSWGHPDTDVYTIFFAAYFIWFFFLTLNAENTKKRIVYSLLCGLTAGLFSLFWTGWWYIFDFALVTLAAYVIYVFLFENKEKSLKAMKESKEIRSVILATGMLVLASAAFITWFMGFSTFTSSVFQPFEFTNIKQASHASLWPNVYTTVAELNQASLKSIIDSIGGNLFFYTSVIGIILLFAIKTDGKRKYMPFALMSTFWYIGILYASTKGIRFNMMLVPPLALGIGAVAGLAYSKLSEYLADMGISKKITKIVVVVVFLVVLMSYAKGISNSSKNDIPIVNDAWYDSLNKIRLESQPNAIINSWWDFGHHFKYFADRAVTFDGASQNTPMAHWIGRVLLTSNEKEALGILRMLDCGSNDAFEILNSHINNSHQTVDMIYDIVVMSRDDARKYLMNKNIPSEKVSIVLEKTHCTPPEDYFITSEDMVGKAAVWAHFGSWDFNKADAWVNARNMPKEEAIKYIQKAFEGTEEEAKAVYFKIKSITNENDANNWIAPWPGYGNEQGCSKENNNLICGGVLINMETKDVKVSTDRGVQNPDALVYAENGELVEKRFDNGIGQSILLIKKGESYKIVISSTQLTRSMFTKLFYYDGAGTSNFEKFSDQTSINQERIIVWKVRW
ncbi:MAG: STT3 domain-containing protein [Nanoarchaeota archaeon]